MSLPFPDNIIEVLKERLGAIEGVESVVSRVVEPSDPNGVLGVVSDEWVADDWQIGSWEPAVGTYKLMIMHLVKNTNAEEGNRTHRLVAKAIRLMLYRDADLRHALGQLREGTDPIERALQWSIAIQRFGSNEIAGQFTFLSVTELNFQTETV